MNNTRRIITRQPNFEDLGERIAPSAISPAELFIDKQLTADIATTAKDFKTLVADVQGTTATQEQITLDILTVNRDLMIVSTDQQLDVSIDTAPAPLTTVPTTPV